MNITEGDCGGFVLREALDGSGKLYLFDVCSDLSYTLMRYLSNDGSTAVTLTQGTVGNIAIDYSDVTIAIVANHSTLDLYINHQKIASATDNSYDSGTIGLVADCSNGPTYVSYQNIKVWALP